MFSRLIALVQRFTGVSGSRGIDRHYAVNGQPTGYGYVFFIFDTMRMSGYYGREAFIEIEKVIRSSRGICDFHDGDVPESAIRQMVRQGDFVGTASGVPAQLKDYRTFGGYLIGMWSNDSANLKAVHLTLCGSNISGYMGYVTLGERVTSHAFVEFSGHLGLVQNLTTRNGLLDGGEDLYSVVKSHYKPRD